MRNATLTARMSLVFLAGTCMVSCAPSFEGASSWRSGTHAVETDLKQSIGYYDSAVTAINNRDYALALEYLQAARAQKPDDVRVLTAFGVVYDKLGRFDLSARYYAQASTLDPKSRVIAADLDYSRRLQGLSTGSPATQVAEAATSPVEPTQSQTATASVEALAASASVAKVVAVADGGQRLTPRTEDLATSKTPAKVKAATAPVSAPVVKSVAVTDSGLSDSSAQVKEAAVSVSTPITSVSTPIVPKVVADSGQSYPSAGMKETAASVSMPAVPKIVAVTERAQRDGPAKAREANVSVSTPVNSASTPIVPKVVADSGQSDASARMKEAAASVPMPAAPKAVAVTDSGLGDGPAKVKEAAVSVSTPASTPVAPKAVAVADNGQNNASAEAKVPAASVARVVVVTGSGHGLPRIVPPAAGKTLAKAKVLVVSAPTPAAFSTRVVTIADDGLGFIRRLVALAAIKMKATVTTAPPVPVAKVVAVANGGQGFTPRTVAPAVSKAPVEVDTAAPVVNTVILTGHPLAIVDASGRGDTDKSVRDYLSGRGWSVAKHESVKKTAQAETVILYRETMITAAKALARTLSLPMRLTVSNDIQGLQLVLGGDISGTNIAKRSLQSQHRQVALVAANTGKQE